MSSALAASSRSTCGSIVTCGLMRTTVVAGPLGHEGDLLHVDLEIADQAPAGEAGGAGASRFDDGVAGILERLDLRPVFQPEALQLRLHELRRGRQVPRCIECLYTALDGGNGTNDTQDEHHRGHHHLNERKARAAARIRAATALKLVGGSLHALRS